MSASFTRTKIIAPGRRRECLTRPRLIRSLFDALDQKITFVVAPAGYGKTTLLVDFASQVEMPVCWLSLDEYDQSLPRFITGLIAAMAHRFPSFGRLSTDVLEGLKGLQPDYLPAATAMANDIYENIREHFVLILDDFHLVSEQEAAAAFFGAFGNMCPENCHLILASRVLPPLPDLPLLVARQTAGGLGYDALAFTAGEIQTLALKIYGISLSNADAQSLAEETEGWITGVILTAQTSPLAAPRRLGAFPGLDVGVYDYLAHQILRQQPKNVRDFLLRSAFFDEFDVGLCELAWGDAENWRAEFSWVQQHNLFVQVVAGSEPGVQVLRYHHLFRDFLQLTYQQECPGELPALLSTVAAAYTRRQDWVRAYAIYRRLDDIPALAALIESAGATFVRTSQVAVLQEWLAALPESEIEKRPGLLSLWGVIFLVGGQAEKSLRYFDQAISLWDGAQNGDNLARTLARRATAHRYLGDYNAAIADAQRVLDYAETAAASPDVQAEARHALGMAQYHRGILSKAIAQFEAALALYRKIDDRQNQALIQMELGICFQAEGKFQRARENFRSALEHWRVVGNTSRLAFVLNNLGWLDHIAGDYAAAAAELNEALEHARRSQATRAQAYLHCSLGDLYSDLEAFSSADQAYAQSAEIARRLDDRFLNLQISLGTLILACRRGRLGAIAAALEAARAPLQANASQYEEGLWYSVAARAALALHLPDEAVRTAALAGSCLAAGGNRLEQARNALVLAQAHWLAGDPPASRAALSEMFACAADLDNDRALLPLGRTAMDALSDAQSDAAIGYRAADWISRVEEFERQKPTLRRKIRPHLSAVSFAPPALSFFALGRVQARLDGRQITSPEWKNQKKVRELLFYLLEHPEGATKEEIGLVFWPDSTSEQLKLQFKNTVYRLRVALNCEAVVFDEQFYRFNPDLDFSYDVADFTGALEKAQQAAHTDEQIAAYQSALSAYRGHFFPDADGVWVLESRERLRLLFQQSALQLALLQLESGQPNDALEVCNTVLREDPCLEEAHRLAMKCYAAAGDRPGVTRQYEICCRSLADELGVKPSPQTVQLYQLLA